MDRDIQVHIAQCDACAAFAARLRRAEGLIQDGLRFDVNTMKAARKQARSSSSYGSGARVAWGAMAAALVGAFALWLTLGGGSPSSVESLAVEAVQHWYNEPNSWLDTDVAATNVALETALDGKAKLDLSSLGTVTYARSCRVGGEWIPHLVVQGERGPIMVLLMPGRAVDDSLSLSLPEEGLGGHLLPHGAGSVVVMGEPGELLESIEQQVVKAVSWTI